MTEHLTVRICAYIRDTAATIDTLCAHFHIDRRRMRCAVGNMHKVGCIKSGPEWPRIYSFVMMPPAAKRPTAPQKIAAEAEIKARGEVVRPYRPTFTPLVRDIFAEWRLRENPETSEAAVHSCRI